MYWLIIMLSISLNDDSVIDVSLLVLLALFELVKNPLSVNVVLVMVGVRF
jgi:hypothetical protein